jgi:hypothetical protein
MSNAPSKRVSKRRKQQEQQKRQEQAHELALRNYKQAKGVIASPCECGATSQATCRCDMFDFPDFPELDEAPNAVSERDLEDAFQDYLLKDDLEDAFRDASLEAEDDIPELPPLTIRQSIVDGWKGETMDLGLLTMARNALERHDMNMFMGVVSQFKKYSELDENPYYDFLLEVIDTGEVDFVRVLLNEITIKDELSWLYLQIIHHAYSTKNFDMVSFVIQYISDRMESEISMLTILDRLKYFVRDEIDLSQEFYIKLSHFVLELERQLERKIEDKKVSLDELYEDPEDTQEQDEKEELPLPSEMELPRNLTIDPRGMIRPVTERLEPVRPVQVVNPGRIRVSLGQAEPSRPTIRFVREPRQLPHTTQQGDVVMPRAPFRPTLVNGAVPQAPARIASRYGKKTRGPRKTKRTKKTKHGLSRKKTRFN